MLCRRLGVKGEGKFQKWVTSLYTGSEQIAEASIDFEALLL